MLVELDFEELEDVLELLEDAFFPEFVLLALEFSPAALSLFALLDEDVAAKATLTGIMPATSDKATAEDRARYDNDR